MLNKQALAALLAEKARQGGIQPNQHVPMGGNAMASQPMGHLGQPNTAMGTGAPHMGMPMQPHPAMPSGMSAPMARPPSIGAGQMPGMTPPAAKFPKLGGMMSSKSKKKI